jgi:hypothetical protein
MMIRNDMLCLTTALSWLWVLERIELFQFRSEVSQCITFTLCTL